MYDESKEESKGESCSNTPIIELVQEYCMATQFENEFEKFADENFDIFSDATEMKDSSEHRLEFYDVYQKYLQKFERKIEDFLDTVSYNVVLYSNSLLILLFIHLYMYLVTILIFIERICS